MNDPELVFATPLTTDGSSNGYIDSTPTLEKSASRTDAFVGGVVAASALPSQLEDFGTVNSWPSHASKLNGAPAFPVVDDEVERQFCRASPYNLRW